MGISSSWWSFGVVAKRCRGGGARRSCGHCCQLPVCRSCVRPAGAYVDSAGHGTDEAWFHERVCGVILGFWLSRPLVGRDLLEGGDCGPPRLPVAYCPGSPVFLGDAKS